MFFVVAVNELLGSARCAGGCVMGAEELTYAVITTKVHQFSRTPTIAAHDWRIPAQFVGLLYDQSHFVVILGGEDELGTRFLDLRQLGAEIFVLGREALVSHHRARTVNLFPALLKEFRQSFGIVTRYIIKHCGFFKAELIGNKISYNRSLEGIQEWRAEHPRSI